MFVTKIGCCGIVNPVLPLPLPEYIWVNSELSGNDVLEVLIAARAWIIEPPPTVMVILPQTSQSPGFSVIVPRETIAPLVVYGTALAYLIFNFCNSPSVPAVAAVPVEFAVNVTAGSVVLILGTPALLVIKTPLLPGAICPTKAVLDAKRMLLAVNAPMGNA